MTNRQRAIALFADYGIWDTEDNCGVLIYMNLADRKVDIVADRGIDRKIDAATWQAMCDTHDARLCPRRIPGGHAGRDRPGEPLLRTHFPSGGRGRTNCRTSR